MTPANQYMAYPLPTPFALPSPYLDPSAAVLQFAPSLHTMYLPQYLPSAATHPGILPMDAEELLRSSDSSQSGGKSEGEEEGEICCEQSSPLEG